MSTVTSTVAHSDSLIGGKTHFLLRRLHSLTGIVFGGYLCVHLLVNATIAQGGEVYQTQVNKIHDLPFLWLVEWTFIYIPLIYHTIYGLYITATGQPNVGQYHFGKNWAYLFQRITAIVIVVFVLFHVLALKYGAFGVNFSFEAHGGAMRSVARHFDRSGYITYLLYPLGILASCFHLANGFWTAGITWGLTVSRSAQRRWGFVCAALFVLTFLAGMIALVAAIKLDPNALASAGATH